MIRNRITRMTLGLAVVCALPFGTFACGSAETPVETPASSSAEVFPDDPQLNSAARTAVSDYLTAFDNADFQLALRKTCAKNRPALERLGNTKFAQQSAQAVAARGKSEIVQSVVSQSANSAMNVVAEVKYSGAPKDSRYKNSIQRMFELQNESGNWTVCGYTDLDDPAYRN